MGYCIAKLHLATSNRLFRSLVLTHKPRLYAALYKRSFASTFNVYESEIYNRLSTATRFEMEAEVNSKMAYWDNGSSFQSLFQIKATWDVEHASLTWSLPYCFLGAEIRSVCTEAGMFAIRSRRKVSERKLILRLTNWFWGYQMFLSFGMWLSGRPPCCWGNSCPPLSLPLLLLPYSSIDEVFCLCLFFRLQRRRISLKP